MAILTTGNTYVDNDQVTAATLNAAINSATFVSGAVDNATTQLSGGAVIVRDGGIISAKIASGAVTAGKYGAGSIVNADVNASAAIADTKLATISTVGKVSNSATTATNANTASAIVARDASGNFSAGTITATLTGNAANVTGVVAIANGGTGSTDAGGARTALGLGTAAVENDTRYAVNSDNLSGLTNFTTARSNLGATTVGANLLTLPNPSAIRFLRLNADNTVSPLSDTDFRTAIGAGSGGGSVTSVGISGADGIGVASSPITTSGTISLTLGSITPDDITSTNFIQGSEYRVSGTKVLGAQQAAESSLSLTGGLIGGDSIDEFALTNAIQALQIKLNSILVKLRNHGIIAT
jgi:hypothetical protein